MIDLNTFIGPYPFRHVPHPDPEVLVRVLQREGISQAWVGSLPGAFHRAPSHANTELYQRLAPHANVLRPVPIVRPDWPDWRVELERAVSHGAAAVRVWPQHWGMGPGDGRLNELAAASRGLPLILTVRLEDVRQRHTIDSAPELSPAQVRELARAGTGARLVVTAASREFVEEVHYGLTPAERALVWWDISWLWGPPVDDLSHLFRTVGAGRLVYGSMWPLRLTQGPRANLELLEPDVQGASLADPSSWASAW